MNTVYIELFLLDNIIINYYFLYLSGALLRFPIKKVRGLISAITGAVYGYLQLQNSFIMGGAFPKIALSILMIYISYTPGRKIFPKLLFTFYCLSFIFAGGIITFFFLTTQNSFWRNTFFLPIPLRFALLILLAGHFFKRYLFRIMALLTYCNQGISLHISSLISPASLSCYSDTGNECTYFGKPVVFVNRNRICLHEEVKSIFDGNIPQGKEHIPIVYIPFKTAGGTLQIVPGFKCEKAVISQGERQKELCLYIALTDHDFGGNPCLINPVLLD